MLVFQQTSSQDVFEHVLPTVKGTGISIIFSGKRNDGSNERTSSVMALVEWEPNLWQKL